LPNGEQVKILIVVLKGFGYVWVTLAVIGLFVGTVRAWMQGGFPAAQEFVSPFEIFNWVALAMTLAPGVGALSWAKSLSENQATQAATLP
jgi:hypothetical protein